MQRWPATGFHAQHSWELYARGEIDLYAGRGREAYRLRVGPMGAAQEVDAAPDSGRAGRVALSARARGRRGGRLTIAASARPGSAPRGRTPASWLARAWPGRARRPSSFAPASVRSRAIGPRPSATSSARSTASRPSTWRSTPPSPGGNSATLSGGLEGEALVRAADDWMASQGIQNPARMAEMLAPGLQT